MHIQATKVLPLALASNPAEQVLTGAWLEAEIDLGHCAAVPSGGELWQSMDH